MRVHLHLILYQKDNKYRRMDKTPKNEKSHVMTCLNCGKDRHPHSKRGGWKINCPAACVKMGSVNCARSKGRSTNIVEISAIGPNKYHPIMVEAEFKSSNGKRMSYPHPSSCNNIVINVSDRVLYA